MVRKRRKGKKKNQKAVQTSQIPVPKLISIEALEALPGIEGIVDSNSTHPRIIIAPQVHAQQFYGALGVQEREEVFNSKYIQELSISLFNQGIKNIMIEGFTNSQVNKYNSTGRLSFNVSTKSEQVYWSQIVSILYHGRWNLICGEPHGMREKVENAEKPILGLLTDFKNKMEHDLSEWFLESATDTGRYLIPNKGYSPKEIIDICKQKHDIIRSSYQKKLDELLDSKINELYSLIVTFRNGYISRQCKKSITVQRPQTLVVVGVSHSRSLAKKLKLPYAILKTKGRYSNDQFNSSPSDLRSGYQLPHVNIPLRFQYL